MIIALTVTMLVGFAMGIWLGLVLAAFWSK